MRARDERTRTLIPPMVSFTTGADLLVRLGIVPNMTREGVRKSTEHPDWPFGPDRPYPYWDTANAELMETGPFLAFYAALYAQPQGRGPDKASRKDGGEPS